MRLNRFSGVLTLALALLAGSAQAAAQNAVSSADIQRLQDTIYDASRDVEQSRARDSAAAAQLQPELDEARDEAVYLQRQASQERSDRAQRYADRSAIESKTSAPGREATATCGRLHQRRFADEDDRRPSRAGTRSAPNDIPVGTEFDVRLQTRSAPKTAQVEDRFEATTMVDLSEGDRVLVPAGSVMRGVVSSVNKAGRIERKGKLTLAFDQITIKGRSYPIRATVTQALESEGIRGETGRIGAGAGVGAIIGGILGGLKGALAGILIGGGGTIAATEGNDVELPAGTVLRVRLDTPLDLR